MSEEADDGRAHLAGVAFGALLISSSPVLVKAIDPAVLGPTAVGFHRTGMAAVVLFLLARLRGERIVPGRPTLLLLFATGFTFAADLFLWHRAIHSVGAGLSTILGNTQVIWVSLVGVALLGERGSLRLVAAVGLAVLGVVGVSGVLAAEDAPRAAPAGVALGLGTGVAFAAYILLLRRLRGRAGRPGALALMGWVSGFTALWLAASAGAEGASLVIPDRRTFALCLALALVVQVAGWLVLSVSMSAAPPSAGALVLLLQPVLATVWGALFFHERLTAQELGGAMLVLLGIYLGALAVRPPTPGRRPAPS